MYKFRDVIVEAIDIFAQLISTSIGFVDVLSVITSFAPPEGIHKYVVAIRKFELLSLVCKRRKDFSSSYFLYPDELISSILSFYNESKVALTVKICEVLTFIMWNKDITLLFNAKCDNDCYSKVTRSLIHSFAYNITVFGEKLEGSVATALYDLLYSMIQVSRYEDILVILPILTSIQNSLDPTDSMEGNLLIASLLLCVSCKIKSKMLESFTNDWITSSGLKSTEVKILRTKDGNTLLRRASLPSGSGFTEVVVSSGSSSYGKLSISKLKEIIVTETHIVKVCVYSYQHIYIYIYTYIYMSG
jgi:hypothetical protein